MTTLLAAARAERRRLRRHAGMTIKARLELEAAQRKAAALPKDSPEGKRAELESRIALGQKDATDIDMRDVDARGLTLDGTQISRAVGASFDAMDINAARLSGPISASTFRGATIRNVSGSNINRDGCNFNGSVQAFNDWSRGSSRNQKWGKVNAYGNSHDKSDMDGLTMHGGWMTQCFFDGISLNGGKIAGTGLQRSSLNDMFGRNVTFQPKLTEDESYSLHGTKLIDSRVAYHVVAKAHDDNATLENCKAIEEFAEPQQKVARRAVPHDRYQALVNAHAEATAGTPDIRGAIAQAYRPVRSLRGLSMLGLAA
jgi:uncharacterized protein YjbI with pentapeptide repeats